MKIDILTLFPDMFEGFVSQSIIKRAIEKGLVEINLIDYRKYSLKKTKEVDDTPFGGGAGMVIMCDPVVKAIEEIKTKDSHIILLDPKAPLYNQKKAYELAKYKHLILICGHYEGIDDRIRNFIDEVICIGDYILTGGEIPAMIISDSVIRLIDGVIDKESLESESFNDNLLDYPVYTKPREYKGYSVPDVLVSGNHKLIDEYRRKEQIRLTKEYRPELLEKDE